MTDIDDDLRLAVDLLVADHGIGDAITELQQRADAGRDGETDRALAALAYVRQEVADE